MTSAIAAENDAALARLVDDLRESIRDYARAAAWKDERIRNLNQQVAWFRQACADQQSEIERLRACIVERDLELAGGTA